MKLCDFWGWVLESQEASSWFFCNVSGHSILLHFLSETSCHSMRRKLLREAMCRLSGFYWTQSLAHPVPSPDMWSISEWCSELRKWMARRQRGLVSTLLGGAVGPICGWAKSHIFQGYMPRSPGHKGVLLGPCYAWVRKPKGVWREMEEPQLFLTWKEGKRKGDANTSSRKITPSLQHDFHLQKINLWQEGRPFVRILFTKRDFMESFWTGGRMEAISIFMHKT